MMAGYGNILRTGGGCLGIAAPHMHGHRLCTFTSNGMHSAQACGCAVQNSRGKRGTGAARQCFSFPDGLQHVAAGLSIPVLANLSASPSDEGAARHALAPSDKSCQVAACPGEKAIQQGSGACAEFYSELTQVKRKARDAHTASSSQACI